MTARHPRLKKEMRVLDLAFFIAEHDDHHLARISELIRRFQSQVVAPFALSAGRAIF